MLIYILVYSFYVLIHSGSFCLSNRGTTSNNSFLILRSLVPVMFAPPWRPSMLLLLYGQAQGDRVPSSPPALRGVQGSGTRRHPSPRSGRQLPIGHRSPSGNRSHFFEIQFNSLLCKVQLILSIVSFLSELSIWYTNLYILSTYILFTLPITFL